jgi:hypothetical protein
MSKAREYLERAKRLIEMDIEEYRNEVIKDHPEDAELLRDDANVWVYRTGVVESLINTSLMYMNTK